MKKLKIIIFIFIFTGLISPVFADSFLNNLSGRILLQVEKNGEAWYLNPQDNYRYYLGRPLDAWDLMREQGIGISNKDLDKIQVGILKENIKDSDNDGLGDSLELTLGLDPFLSDSDRDGFKDGKELEENFNPQGSGKIIIDHNFSLKNSGKIFLQVEKNGEAWYINPDDLRRYYLGRPVDAFNLMRFLGLGISDSNIGKIPAKNVSINITFFEQLLFDLVNEERVKAGLNPLILNKEVAQVAREHSSDLVKENKFFTGEEKVCDFPIIHHEGLEFGLYSSNRLQNRGINYFSMSGENIALVSNTNYKVSYNSDDPIRFELENCESERSELDERFKEKLENLTDEQEKIDFINSEIKSRTDLYNHTSNIRFTNTNIKDEEKLAKETVDGWMNSPGHRANILNKDFNQGGMGVAFMRGYAISTQVFIRKIDCGYTGAKCCNEENTIYCYAPNTCENSLCLISN